MTSNEPKAEELRALLLAKGYNVECEWRTEGWHFALTKPHSFRSVFVFDHGLMDDWTSQQILSFLETHHLDLVLEVNEGKKILRVTKSGFQ